MERIRKVIREEVRKTSDVGAATRHVFSWLKRNPDVYESLKTELIALAINTMVNEERTNLRHTVVRAAAPPMGRVRTEEEVRGALAAVVKVTHLTILTHYYIGNKPLGDCTKREILDECDRLERIVAGFDRKLSLFRAITTHLPEDCSVAKNYVTEEQCAAIEARSERGRTKVSAG